MAADGSLFNRSITVHSSIHARLIANQFVYTPDTPLQIHGKGGQVVNYVLQNSRTLVFVILHTLRYVSCNASCRMVYKVVSMTQIPHLCSSCPSEIFLGYSYETGSGLVYLAKVNYCH